MKRLTVKYINTLRTGVPVLYAINKLADYENKEEQGLLLQLPFKVGDTAYIVVGKNVSKQKIIWIELHNDDILFMTRKRKFSTKDIGKCVFCTNEKAEKMLADSLLK